MFVFPFVRLIRSWPMIRCLRRWRPRPPSVAPSAPWRRAPSSSVSSSPRATGSGENHGKTGNVVDREWKFGTVMWGWDGGETTKRFEFEMEFLQSTFCKSFNYVHADHAFGVEGHACSEAWSSACPCEVSEQIASASVHERLPLSFQPLLSAPVLRLCAKPGTNQC